MEKFIEQYGQPEQVQTDNGVEFTNDIHPAVVSVLCAGLMPYLNSIYMGTEFRTS